MPETRTGFRAFVSILLPEVRFASGETASDVTGVAINVKQNLGISHAPRPGGQEYEVYALSGLTTCADVAAV